MRPRNPAEEDSSKIEEEKQEPSDEGTWGNVVNYRLDMTETNILDAYSGSVIDEEHCVSQELHDTEEKRNFLEPQKQWNNSSAVYGEHCCFTLQLYDSSVFQRKSCKNPRPLPLHENTVLWESYLW